MPSSVTDARPRSGAWSVSPRISVWTGSGPGRGPSRRPWRGRSTARRRSRGTPTWPAGSWTYDRAALLGRGGDPLGGPHDRRDPTVAHGSVRPAEREPDLGGDRGGHR